MLVVEPVRPGDVDSVARLAMAALQAQYDPAWLADQVEQGRGLGTFLVARDVPTNHVVGFALANQESCEAHLLALAVEGRRQGQGIGSALLANVRQELSRAGAYKLNLEVRADDPKARQFYERHGFWPEGLEPHVYSDGGDAIRMARPL